MEITTGLKKRFCKDFNIPIKLFDEPYFQSRLELFNNQYRTLEKWDLFQKELLQFQNEQEYFSFYNKLKDTIIEHLKNKPEYTDFIGCSMDKFKIDDHKIPIYSIYSQSNVEKELISFDLKQANFNALKYFNSNLVDNLSSYEDFIRQFTQLQHIVESKYIRQVVFGNCNPKRQTTIEKYLMSIILDILLCYIDVKEILTYTDDEIVINMPSKEIKEKIYKNIEAATKLHEFIVKKEEFVLKYICEADVYYKLHDDGSFELKCADGLRLPFLLRKLNNEPVNEYDTFFYHEGMLCKILQNPLER